MKTDLIEITEYTLEPNDITIIKNALIYVKHRITQHPECGAKFVGLGGVERLLKEFEE